MISGRVVRVLGVLSVVLGLAGCQSLDDSWMDTMSDMGLVSGPDSTAEAADVSQAPPEASPAPSAATADAGTENWCAQVAAQERDKSAAEGYDAPSVERRYAVAYRQCLGVTAAAPSR